MMSGFVYKHEKTREISFPLGGIGTGCIGLAGNGRLIDWEIFNRPNKGNVNGFSHFAIKAESEGKVLDARVINGDLEPPYTGEFGGEHFNSFGFGPPRATMAGAPHFDEVEFKGEYPLASLKFMDHKFPGEVTITAFNPFIPLNDKDSSIPGAFFEIEVENTAEVAIDYTLCLSVNNPHPNGTNINTYCKQVNIHQIKFTSNKFSEDEPEFGDITIATDADSVSYQEYWYRGTWFDNLGIFWRDFTSLGQLKNRTYCDPGSADMGSLAAHIQVSPGDKKSIRFVITWNFPNCYNYWNPEECECSKYGCGDEKPKTWRNYYATVFRDSADSAIYSLTNWDRLYKDTLLFKNALFASTLPKVALEAISANISILKTPTCLRMEDGSFYGFEGCHCDSGCCEGSCTHVWNYAYALPFLFPKLERSMRDLDFIYNQREDGGMAFRLQLPLGRERSEFRPCADGQFGGVIKAYRDWKISGNIDWLKSNWDAIKKSIEFAWADTNQDRWDPEKSGVLTGRQHHTLDMELFGPNSWLTGFYLAALKAGAEIAEFLGEKEKAHEYMEIFAKGKKWVNENLFNGEYFYQLIALKDKSILERYEGESLHGDDVIKAYWNNEAKEIKYQIGEGCGIDQVLAQWHANICGIGEIFHKNKTKKALESLYNYNFKKRMKDFFNPCRLFSLNDEAGIVICDWPQGKYKPVVPVPYSEETMNGFEYQAAIHMIQEGLIEEGLEIVKAIRDRYDGERRNPWNEFECGSNYARSMASYALLLTFSRFEYNMVEGMIGFNPIQYGTSGKRFKSFWSLDSAWGLFEVHKDKAELKVLYGNLELKILRLPFLKGKDVKAISFKDLEVSFENIDGDMVLKTPIRIEEDSSLIVEY
jgi:non-lysosomal glucosylceramidase